MKCLALFFLLFAPACYGHAVPAGFSFALEHPRVPQTPTAGDDLAVALAAHGLDPALAPVAATVIEILISNNNTLTQRLTADEAAITTLQKQVAALTPKTAALPFSIPADRCAVPGACPGVATQDTQALDGNKIFLTTGQTFDYAVTLAAAGNYVLGARLCNSQGSVGVTTVHFEFPAGTPIGGALTLPAGQQWTTLSTPAVALPAGAITLRLVVDASATPVGNGGIMDAITGTPQ
jgi:hypothetical protein